MLANNVACTTQDANGTVLLQRDEATTVENNGARTGVRWSVIKPLSGNGVRSWRVSGDPRVSELQDLRLSIAQYLTEMQYLKWPRCSKYENRGLKGRMVLFFEEAFA